MQTQSRIPKLAEMSFDGALVWFSEMQCRGLLFHPEDDPGEITHIADGSKQFSNVEVRELRLLIDQLETAIGHDKTIEAAYPIFMRAVGRQLDA